MLKKIGIMFGVILLGYFVLMVSASYNKKMVAPVSDQQVELAISQSDDFVEYRAIFISSSQTLLQEGRCSWVELEESGGWYKSTNYKSKPIYFMHCGGLRATKIYLNTLTGEIY
ncbi:MAG: hypothetical protein ISEC1_P1532 [Thiomicrorhabdus sp.]|nr:MAG: hypothetical protein ISEC1_P1532 [Thiomicrorhabdus sp.]